MTSSASGTARPDLPPELQQDDDALIALTPRHVVRIDREYLAFIQRAPSTDFVVRTLVRREANGLELMTADVVIAGADTRARFPLTNQYPLHFRKAYFPGRLHGDPQDEFARQAEASAVIGVPAPLGFTPMTFRTCLLPGKPYNRLSPFGVEPEESNIKIARDVPLATAAGLFSLVEKAVAQLLALHATGLAHGDAELHNFVVTPSPLEILPIDFEASVRRESMDEAAWQARCAADLHPLLREAVFLQCALGPQTSQVADLAWHAMDRLFRNPDRFRREIGRQLDLHA